MLKKLALPLLAALFSVACHDDDSTLGPTICPSSTARSYSGTLDVTPLEGSPFTAFSEQEIIFALAPTDDGTYTLLMPRIKFVPQMPVYISFEVRNLVPTFDDAGGFTFSVDQTVPYRNGAPYDPDGQGTYTIYRLSGSSTDGETLTASFDCYTMHVAYSGERQ